MKEVKVSSYKKRDLVAFCMLVLLLGAAALVGGIMLIVNVIATPTSSLWWKVILGVFLCLLGAIALVFGIIMAIVTKSTIDTNGSVKLDNPVKGTKNMNKCPNCYKEIEEDAEFCPHCGKKVRDGVTCKCGQLNSLDAEFCKKCGAKLKK